MTERKTDVLNVRVDPKLAAEIDRIAAWRGTSASEVARDLINYGVRVERQLQAQELHRPYSDEPLKRTREKGFLKIEAAWHWYTLEELVQHERELTQAEELHDELTAYEYRNEQP